MTDAALESSLPVGSMGRLANGAWGMLTLIATEGACLFICCSATTMLRSSTVANGCRPTCRTSNCRAPDTVLLLASSVVAWWGEQRSKTGGEAACCAVSGR